MSSKPDPADPLVQLLDALVARLAPVLAERVAAEVQAHTPPRDDRRQDDLLTIGEVADLLRCSARTVTRQIAVGRLVAKKNGGGVLVERRDLTAFRAAWGRA